MEYVSDGEAGEQECECGAAGDHNFAHYEQGGLNGMAVCRECGLEVVPRFDFRRRVVPAPAKLSLVVDEPTRADTPWTVFKNSYRRQAHLMERFRMACLMEPEMSEEHLQMVTDKLRELYGDDGSGLPDSADDEDYPPVNKRPRRRHIQHALRAIDTEQGKKSRFCNKYLEKWRSIRKEWLQQHEDVMTDEELVIVGALFVKFSNCWDQMQPRERKRDRQQVYRFPERHHFPYFNYAMQVCMHICEVEYVPSDWPLPTMKRCLQQQDVYMRALCEKLDIVFPEAMSWQEVRKREPPKKKS